MKQREIKFKCWIAPFNKMSPAMALNDMIDKCCGDEGVLYLQFTGLYDKNKNPIYEGDIVIMFSTQLLIECYRGSMGYFTSRGEKFQEFHSIATHNHISIIKDQLTKCETIGNIYENPSLLSPSNNQ